MHEGTYEALFVVANSEQNISAVSWKVKSLNTILFSVNENKLTEKGLHSENMFVLRFI